MDNDKSTARRKPGIRNWKFGCPGRLLPAACCLSLLLGGCPEPTADSNGTPGESPMAGVTLRLQVVGDPAMARAIGLLRGEWNAQTGSEVQVESITEAQLADAEQLSADAVICPSHQLGVLAERGLVAPLPKEMLQDDSADWAETFELPKLREAAWGPDIMGLTFGSPVFTCYYRADLLQKLGRRPPRTWAEYEKLAAILADHSDLLDPAGDASAENAQNEIDHFDTLCTAADSWVRRCLRFGAFPTIIPPLQGSFIVGKSLVPFGPRLFPRSGSFVSHMTSNNGVKPIHS